jgi:hypothetical protein
VPCGEVKLSFTGITNLEGNLKSGRKQVGFYMDGYLLSNLLGVFDYIRKDWDCIGIISGHGYPRMGKSTIAFQVGSLLAWIFAGGVIDLEVTKENGKDSLKINSITQPHSKIKFTLDENVVFSALDLKKRAQSLYEKYGKNQIIVYDEGREGLDAKRAMESLNKVMEDFFQECGFMGHVILIVLPNFFKLHEDYAITRSIFLIDCFRDKKKRRGYFNFYDEKQKEWLYFLGKKRIGITFKYDAAGETFWGRFTSWFPFDRREYEKKKLEAMKKRERSWQQMNWKRQRDALLFLLKKETENSSPEISKKLEELTGIKLADETIDHTIEKVGSKVIGED